MLPYPDFKRSARCLDKSRLGKQRSEVKGILTSLKQGPKIMYLPPSHGQPHRYIYGPILDPLPEGFKIRKTPWYNHPAVKMWRGHTNALKLYLNTCIKEWLHRKCNNNMDLAIIEGKVVFPSWLGDEDFHASHRSNLLRKDYDFYSRFGWTEPPDLPYVWPVR